jgi:hypothetical protein
VEGFAALRNVYGKRSCIEVGKMGPICCPETSARNYQYSMRNIPEEGSPRGLDLSSSGLGRVRAVVDYVMNFRFP